MPQRTVQGIHEAGVNFAETLPRGTGVPLATEYVHLVCDAFHQHLADTLWSVRHLAAECELDGIAHPNPSASRRAGYFLNRQPGTCVV